MRFTWGLLLGALVGGVLALALFTGPLCRQALTSKSRGFLTDTFGSGLGGFLGDLTDNLVSKV